MSAAVATIPTTMTLTQLIDDYLEACEGNPKIRPNTVAQYSTSLKGRAKNSFLSWCERQKEFGPEGITEPADLDLKTLNGYTTYLQKEYRKADGKPLAPESILGALRTINQALNWGRKRAKRAKRGADYEVGEDNATLFPLQRQERETLTPEEVQRMEDACGHERDKLIIRLLFNTGLRLGELIRLRVQDLQAEKGGAVLKVRGSKVPGLQDDERERQVSRVVPVQPPALARRLQRYIDRTRPKDAATDRLFVSTRRQRNTGDYVKLDDRSIQTMIKVAAEVAGIKKRVWPHLLRHSYTTHMLRRKMNPMLVAQTLGHKDLSMVMAVYSHLDVSDAAREMAKALRVDDDDE